jgi:hypothetical protein
LAENEVPVASVVTPGSLARVVKTVRPSSRLRKDEHFIRIGEENDRGDKSV